MEGRMATKQTAAVAAKTGTMKVPATAAAATTSTVKQTGALTPAAKDAPPKAPSKFVATVQWDGAAKRVHVAEYQDMTFAVNPTKKLTDVELAADWRRVFPNAVQYTEFHVQGARRDFNAGRHSKEFRGRTFNVPEFILVDGKRMPVTEAPKPEPKATTAPVTPKPEPKATAPVAPKAKGMTIKANRIKRAA